MKFMNLKKKIAPALMGGALAVATAVPAFAAEAGTGLSSVETALTTSFTSVGRQALSERSFRLHFRSWELFSLLDLVSKHLRKLQTKPDGFQNGLLTWCKVREGDTFLTFFMQMYLKNNAA